MDYTLKERGQRILEACLLETGTNPMAIFDHIAKLDFVRMHGPEHHILDGAALLTAFHNAGGRIELPAALAELMNRGLAMPGAACGHWGVCGAVTSLGAALSIIDGTGPFPPTAPGETIWPFAPGRWESLPGSTDPGVASGMLT